MHDEHHWPKPEFEAPTRCHHSAQQTSTSQCDDPNRAIHKSDLSCCKAKPSNFTTVEQKRRDQLHQLRFSEAIKQKKEKQNTDTFFAEKGIERRKKIIQELK